MYIFFKQELAFKLDPEDIIEEYKHLNTERPLGV